MQRLVYWDSGPAGCRKRSEASSFLRKSSVGRGRSVAPSSIEHFDRVHIGPTSPAWSLLDTPLFSRHPYPEEYTGSRVRDFVSNLETWALSMESTEERAVASSEEHGRRAALLRAAFEQYQIKQAATLVDAVVASFSRGADVVALNAPAGAGKSLLAAAIVKEVLAREREGQPGGQLTRGEPVRSVASLTKSLQVVPSASNAASLARFSAAKPNDVTVRGALHSMCSVDGELDPSLEGVEHVIVPYSAAEKLLETGRFKFVILDEAHCGDSHITTVRVVDCILKALRGAAAAPSSSVGDFSDGSRTVDKVLVMYGVVDEGLEDQLERLVAAASAAGKRILKYEHIQIPAEEAKWRERRFRVEEHVVHAVGTRGEFGTHTTVSDEVARRLNRTEQQLEREDREICSESATRDGLVKVPRWLVNRCVVATKVLMRKFRIEAEGHVEKVNGALKGLESGGLSEARFNALPLRYNFPSILVCVPSTGVARDVVKQLRFSNDDNHLALGPGTIQPYRIDISCARENDEEKALTTGMDELPVWYSGGKNVDCCKYFGKGRVILAVNGAETGLTIPDVGGIVEFGMEWMRDGYTRSGLSSYRFFLTDDALAQQRLGRGGRTRPTDHILCLGRTANEAKIESKAAVLSKMRSTSMNQVDFVRQACEPALRHQERLRSRNWAECAVEARVNGTVHESVDVEDRLKSCSVYAPLIDIELRNYPTLDPVLSQLLRAFVSNGLALHGVIRVAMLATESTALMKPSTGNCDTAIGPCPKFNSLDIFRKGIVSYAHGGKALKDYEGDSLPLVEMHAQLIKAAGWDLTSDVPGREALLAAATEERNVSAKQSNFWMARWLPSGRVKWHKTLAERMDNTKSAQRREGRDATFTYGRLICDEERRKLWSVIRMLVFDLRLAGIIKDPKAVGRELLNEHVRFVDTDPLLNSKGRTLFAVINTAYSTRFAAVSDSCRVNVTKARGHCKEYFQVVRGDGSGEYAVEEKIVRAESIWDVRPDQKWLRFDPSSLTRAAAGGDVHIAPADPLTAEQYAIFANIVGRWRHGSEKSHGQQMAFVETELNACPSLCGLRLEEVDEKRADDVAYLRYWLRCFVAYYPNRKDAAGQYAAGIDRIVQLWDATSSATPQTRSPAPSYQHFDD